MERAGFAAKIGAVADCLAPAGHDLSSEHEPVAAAREQRIDAADLEVESPVHEQLRAGVHALTRRDPLAEQLNAGYNAATSAASTAATDAGKGI